MKNRLLSTVSIQLGSSTESVPLKTQQAHPVGNPVPGRIRLKFSIESERKII